MKSSIATLAATIGLVAFTGAVLAAPVSTPQRTQRADLTYKIVKKWGSHVQETYSLPVRSWAMEMLPLFRLAPMDALQVAAQAKSFDGMNDALLQTKSANSGRPVVTASAGRTVTSTTKVLGALTNDLVYTPIQPCRIVDTRSTGAGIIPANSNRSFVGVNSSNFIGQGGSATNCGTLSLAATALAINFTAVAPVVPPAGGGGPGTGFLTVFPFGTTQPTIATMVFRDTVTLSNSAIVQIPNPIASFDFTVYTSSQTHLVADIVGYFAAPLATALQCVETLNTSTPAPGVLPNDTRNELAPNCPTGYTQTTTNCTTSSWLMPIVFSKDGTCSARNNDSSNAILRASRTCCRVPGR